MAKITNHSDSDSRQRLLNAALKCFANRGYAATSVREIVDAAGLAKPALYYYFDDKESIFGAVVDTAHEERYQLMRAAAERGKTLAEKLEDILADLFEHALRNLELIRLTFATAFANAGDAPGCSHCREKARRNFDFVKSLIEQAQETGELDRSFAAQELAMGIYGQLNSYVMVRLLLPDCELNRQTARSIVRLFLHGARNPSGKAPSQRKAVPVKVSGSTAQDN